MVCFKFVRKIRGEMYKGKIAFFYINRHTQMIPIIYFVLKSRVSVDDICHPENLILFVYKNQHLSSGKEYRILQAFVNH